MVSLYESEKRNRIEGILMFLRLEKALERAWIANKINKWIIGKKIDLEFIFKAQMARFKLSYFEYIMWTSNSFDKSIMLGKEKGKRMASSKPDRFNYNIKGCIIRKPGWPGWGQVLKIYPYITKSQDQFEDI